MPEGMEEWQLPQVAASEANTHPPTHSAPQMHPRG